MKNSKKVVYIIAGEPSGDYLGAQLIKSLKLINKDVIFKGIGGDLMAERGLKSLFNIEKIAIMGIFKVLLNIFKLKKLINLTVKDIIKTNPSVLVTIDSPGFNIIIAKKIKELNKNIKLVHYVAPSVWAWKPKRAEEYSRVFNYLFCLLPFEPIYFEKHGLKSYFVGHSIVEIIDNNKEVNIDLFSKYKKHLNKNLKTLLLLPGSRLSEVETALPLYISVINNLSKVNNEKFNIIIPTVSITHNYVLDYIKKNNIKALAIKAVEEKYSSYKIASLAIATSGTVSLELALANVNTIVVYKTNFITNLIIKTFIKLNYASIINIIANKEVIKEFIGLNTKTEDITKALADLLKQKSKIQDNNEVIDILNELGYNKFTPSMKAAEFVDTILRG